MVSFGAAHEGKKFFRLHGAQVLRAGGCSTLLIKGGNQCCHFTRQKRCPRPPATYACRAPSVAKKRSQRGVAFRVDGYRPTVTEESEKTGRQGGREGSGVLCETAKHLQYVARGVNAGCVCDGCETKAAVSKDKQKNASDDKRKHIWRGRGSAHVLWVERSMPRSLLLVEQGTRKASVGSLLVSTTTYSSSSDAEAYGSKPR